MRDYGKVHTSFWTSSNIRELSEDGRTLAIYLLTCPHGTIAGVFRLPDGYACEDLQWSADRVQVTLSELLSNGFATRCEATKWVWVTKHLEWNPPENPNQIKAAAKMAFQVPDSCTWKAYFIGKHGVYLGLVNPKVEPLTNPSETVSEPVTVTVTVTEAATVKKDKSAAPPFVLPDWINAKHWETWHSTPKRKKATTAQKQMAVDKLDAWRKAGDDYAGALENAAIGGNQGLFLPNKPAPHAAQPESFRERDARLAREKWERMTGEQHPDHAQTAPVRSILDVVDIEIKTLGMAQ